MRTHHVCAINVIVAHTVLVGRLVAQCLDGLEDGACITMRVQLQPGTDTDLHPQSRQVGQKPTSLRKYPGWQGI